MPESRPPLETVDMQRLETLIGHAREVRERAYAPYSVFRVGAALLGDSGRIYTGCNVENVSYGLTICAERVAVFKGISEGECEFGALAVVTETGATPCGACRQVLAEFGSRLTVVVARPEGDWLKVFSLQDLLPYSFHMLK